MPICIECCQPVSQLYTTYSKADDRALGKGVRLTQCPRCKRFADKYVEHDYVVLFIDLVLTKPQVYRHLLFNRLWSGDETFDQSLIRLAILIFMIEFHLAWARLEKTNALSKSALVDAPIIAHYAFCLLLKILGGLAFHCTVRLLAGILVPQLTASKPPSQRVEASGNSRDSLSLPANAYQNLPDGSDDATTRRRHSKNATATAEPISSSCSNPYLNIAPDSPMAAAVLDNFSNVEPSWDSSAAARHLQPIPPPPLITASSITAALIVSSCTKLFPILLVIWPPEEQPVQSPSPTTTTTATTTITLATIDSIPSDATPSMPSIPSPIWRTVVSRFSAHCASLAASASALVPTIPSSSSLSHSNAMFSSLSSSVLRPLFSFVLSITNTHLVLLNNVEALNILLGCGYVRAATVVLGGQIARIGTERLLLRAAGL